MFDTVTGGTDCVQRVVDNDDGENGNMFADVPEDS